MSSFWRRDPIGAGIAAISQRKRNVEQTMGYLGLLNLTDEEFEQKLRQGGASNHMVQVELDEFRRIKKAREEDNTRREQELALRRRKIVPKELSKYEQIEQRFKHKLGRKDKHGKAT